MADKHVRARCESTGAETFLPKRVLDRGYPKGWHEATDSPELAEIDQKRVDDFESGGDETQDYSEE